MRGIIKIILVVLLTFFVLAWAPWLTDEYAIDKIMEKLGDPNASFSYLGETMLVKDIPKKVSWFLFARYVTFPGEAGWFVTFYGEIV